MGKRLFYCLDFKGLLAFVACQAIKDRHILSTQVAPLIVCDNR